MKTLNFYQNNYDASKQTKYRKYISVKKFQKNWELNSKV